MRNKTFKLLFVLLPIFLILVGCKKEESNLNIPQSASQTIRDLGDAYATDIIAGQNLDVGDIEVWFDEDNVYVKYLTTDNWYLTECHLHIGASLSDIPQVKGNPVPGQFAYAVELTEPTQSYTFTIPLGEWSQLEELYFAAHCVVCEIIGGEKNREETGWGNGNPFPGSNWGRYFCLCPKKRVRLPQDAVTLKFVRVWSNNYYYEYLLSNVPPGYSIGNGTYYGWCVDRQRYIYLGQNYDVTLYSSYDPNLPNYARYPKWRPINWVINHKSGYTPTEIQNVIWYLSDQKSWDELTPREKIFASKALIFGRFFYPRRGQLIAIVNCIDAHHQLTFLEIDP
ncbi:MAG: hypothetical protein ABIK78_05690 [candidate division WOR-3 bacterium]